MAEPRKEIRQLGETLVAKAIEPLSWSLIEARCAKLDRDAPGGVSADATLILSLVCHLVDAKCNSFEG